MRNTGILLFLIGLYVVINSGSFRDLVFGKATFGFITPNAPSTTKDKGGTFKKPGGTYAS